MHAQFPHAAIDWVVAKPLSAVIEANPLVRNAIAIEKHAFWKSIRSLRKQTYDVAFDLQRNCKSGLLTAFARCSLKVGFGRRTVREWPNLLATHLRFDVDKAANMQLQYLELVQSYVGHRNTPPPQGCRLTIDAAEQQLVRSIIARAQHPTRIMVCPGSKWPNKQLPLETLISFLKLTQASTAASLFLMWGNDAELSLCKAIEKALPQHSLIIDKLPIPVWQNLMQAMDLVIAFDSSALHLCGTTQTPSFSLFGPTMQNIFRPMGERHMSIQGSCPYNTQFEKTCPRLRTCPTGACIRNLSAEAIYAEFSVWWKQRHCLGSVDCLEYRS